MVEEIFLKPFSIVNRFKLLMSLCQVIHNFLNTAAQGFFIYLRSLTRISFSLRIFRMYSSSLTDSDALT